MKCFAIFIVALIAGASAVPCPPKAENTNNGGFLNLDFLGSAVGTVGQTVQSTLNTGVSSLNSLNLGGIIDNVEDVVEAVAIAVANLVAAIAATVDAIATAVAQAGQFIAQHAAYFSKCLQQTTSLATQLTGHFDQITGIVATTVTSTASQLIVQVGGTVKIVVQQLHPFILQVTSEVKQISSSASETFYNSFTFVHQSLTDVVRITQQTVQSVNVSQFIQTCGGLAYQLNGFFNQAQVIASQVSQQVLTLAQQAAQQVAQTLIAVVVGLAQVVQFVATVVAKIAEFVAHLAKHIRLAAQIFVDALKSAGSTITTAVNDITSTVESSVNNIHAGVISTVPTTLGYVKTLSATFTQNLYGLNQLFASYNLPIPKCGV